MEEAKRNQRLRLPLPPFTGQKDTLNPRKRNLPFPHLEKGGK